MGNKKVVTRCVNKAYAYPERKSFYNTLISKGFRKSTAKSYATGVVNANGTTFKRARQLWMMHMNGLPYPPTESEIQGECEPPKPFNLFEKFNKKPEPQKEENSPQESQESEDLVEYKLNLISRVLSDRKRDGSSNRQTVQLIKTILDG